jgi:hypothetical protein
MRSEQFAGVGKMAQAADRFDLWITCGQPVDSGGQLSRQKGFPQVFHRVINRLGVPWRLASRVWATRARKGITAASLSHFAHFGRGETLDNGEK